LGKVARHFALGAVFAAGVGPAIAGPDATQVLREIIHLACPFQIANEAIGLEDRLTGFLELRAEPRNVDLIGWRARYAVEGGEVTVERIAPGGELASLSAVFRRDSDAHPQLVAVADFTCTIQRARRVVYDPAGAPVWLQRLDAAFEPVGAAVPFNPPVPDGVDPGGVAVAMIDTGVNYLLPDLAARLARDDERGILGYDFWDLDRRPFDVESVRSNFFPFRHGTRTANILIAEAPVARLIPYRYPRPDMARMDDLIVHAASHHVRLVNMSLVSRDSARWAAYLAAARRHDTMLFIVAAGNKRRDLDRIPMYPAAFPLANQLTVTAATPDGRLLHNANWGREAVDLMVPAQDLLVVGFEGTVERVSGSSYAAARVTALAACLLASNLAWGSQRLRAEIVALAIASADSARVKNGFIADQVLANQGACRHR
jgi:subtilisin family serine protease